uniref:Secreted protein n=1 Tax=Anopheles merus TaxID=30066 RepID=A0A182V548_ANOME
MMMMMMMMMMMTFADAPTNVPLPPRHGPNASAQTIGCSGKPRYAFSDSATTIFTIMAVTGMLSTNADVRAEIHSMMTIATASRRSSDTDRMIVSVACPIQSISPIRSTASISVNMAAKNSSVGHSTRDSTASMSFLSEMISSSTTPSRAAQPDDRRRSSGIDSRKNSDTIKTHTTPDLIRSGRFLIGCSRCSSSSVDR